MMMRVTLIGHYPPPYGGVATLMKQMENALSHNDCEVSIFNLGSGRPSGANVVNFKTNNRVVEFFQLLRAFACWDTDVFHYLSASYRSFWLGTVCIALARLAGRKIVVSFVGGAFKDFVSALGPAKVSVAGSLLRLAHGLVSCNSEIEGVLSSMVPGKQIHRMTNCFPLCSGDRSELPSAVEEFLASHFPVICSTGAASPEYGLVSAVQALGKLRRGFPDVGLVLVLTKYGDPSYEEELNRAIEELKLEGRVLVQRDLPDFISLLERCDVLLRSTLADGDSVSVREAVSLGVPAVASDTPFRPEGVTLFRKGDPEDMAEKLSNALGRTEKPLPVETERENAENLEVLLGIYRDVLATGGAPGSERRFCARGGRSGP
jgi:glycogen(starch) synthase